MTVKICISIMPKTIKEALNSINKAKSFKPNFIEIRLDCLKEYDRIGEIVDYNKIPMIATNRRKGAGGKFSGTKKEHKKILFKAAEEGFKYIDVELHEPNLQVFLNKLRETNVKPIISFHDYFKTPSLLKMHEILTQQMEKGAEICKIVTTAKKIEDNLTVLDFVRKASEKSKIICFSMGNIGITSRILSPIFGGYFTITSLEKRGKTAPGQIAIKEIKEIYQKLGVI